MQRALESLLAELVLGREIDLGDRAAVSGWLSRHGVGEEDARAIESSDLERLGVYRRLARGTLREAVELAIPRSIARLGALFDEYFARFLEQRGPRSHYLRDVTTEFLDFAEPLLRADRRAPDYICDLARHEALRIEIASERGLPRGEKPAPLELDRGVRFVPASRVVRYAFAVHRLPDDEADRTPPAREPTALFVYRSPQHDVRYLELSRLAAAILELLLSEGRTLREAVSIACEGENAVLDDSVLSGTAHLLADLAERGALLGPAVPLDSPWD